MNSQRQGKGLAFVSNQKDFCRRRAEDPYAAGRNPIIARRSIMRHEKT